MIKLTDLLNKKNLLKELNIQPKNIMGQGGEHTAYPFKTKPGFVIKKLIGDNKYFTKEDWMEIIQTAQQHPNIFAKIDKVDFNKEYIVQEKLDEKSLTKDLLELDNYARKNIDLFQNPKFKSNNVGLDILTILYSNPDQINILNNTPYEKTLKPKLENLFNRLENAGFGIDGNYLGDLRISNVGYDITGKIKILDFNFDEL